MTFQILSWNILQGGGKRMTGISRAIEVLNPDILILQEYRANKVAMQLHDSLATTGLVNTHHASKDAKSNSVMIASRYDIMAKAWTDTLPASQAVRVSVQPTDFSNFDILAAHFPHKKKQIPFFSALLDNDVAFGEHALLIGDLNCGIPFEDSETKTFDNTHLFQALLQESWNDSWRSRHRTEREYSWISPRGNGYRYDHCLSTQAMDNAINDIRYLHEYREQGLSDHSPVLVTIA